MLRISALSIYLFSAVAALAQPTQGKSQDQPLPSTASTQIQRVQLKPFAKLSSEEAKSIENVRVLINYGNSGDRVAKGIRDELERLGMKICEFEPRRQLPDGYATNIIYYEKGKHLEAADTMMTLLKKNGYNEIMAKGTDMGCDIHIYVF